MGQVRLPSGVSADRAGEPGTRPSSANLTTAGRVPCFPWSGLQVGPRAPRDRQRQLGRRPLARAQAAPAPPRQRPSRPRRQLQVPLAVSRSRAPGRFQVGSAFRFLVASPSAGGPLEHKDGRLSDTRRPRDRGRGGPRTIEPAKAAFMVTARLQLVTSVTHKNPFKANFIFSLAAEKTGFGPEAACRVEHL